jgi:hypothetical protein
MRKKVLALGIVSLIVGITLISLASIPLSSRWVAFYIYDSHKSELILNKSFEVTQANITNYQVHLDAGDNITITAAISKPGTNRNVGANIDFTLNAGTQTYLSFDRAPNITLSWTAPKSGNYSLNFDNSNDSSSKEVIVMVMKYWRETEHPMMLVNTPLIGYNYLWVGAAVCVVGVAIIILELLKRTTNVSSNMGYSVL